ncbi:(deoxy)nucleoside triphosphate pyrophosphohydrolase [Sandaracinobacteroides saxicola]|uniref:8-oxo-dGTP diphosphatase n=1 Tax=Sandaracinobacteroides saxicola TaxID=2759707 RepID=A0A7G5IMV0_9SPHN|nr:(deoxy)nucleoside triphosphate pyrophosphohydrolase [Sandaracinobacteroides saxicola]QMW24692.1 (deoxy)nucleoside triphosphate pyrophosphohydrolase [Sandaracinobacteroides saxicola]
MTADCPGGSPRSQPILTVACAALVDADGRVLVAQRPAGKPMAGLWEFPGGKLEPDEPPETALVRELREELGIDTHESCLAPIGFASHGYDRFHLILLAFAIRKWRGTPRGREGQALRWLRVNELWTLDMPAADKPLLGQIAALL